MTAALAPLVPWVSDAELVDEPQLVNAKLPTGITIADLCAAATDCLWLESAARYDLRKVTLRPSRLSTECEYGWALNTGYGVHRHDIREIRLEGPSSDITVTVEGVEVGDASWTLVDGHRLIRLDGAWPCCQDLSRPLGEPGTWSIGHTVGLPPSPLGRLAARELTIQLALYHSGKDSKLPKGTSSVTRAGITVDIDTPRRTRNGEGGTSALPTVELFLGSVNPGRQRQAPLVLSPDTLVGGRIS